MCGLPKNRESLRRHGMQISPLAVVPELPTNSTSHGADTPAYHLSPLPPWLATDAFPLRPSNSDYGFMVRNKLIGCSREVLIRKCSREEIPDTHLVWTPENPRLVPPSQVPFLFDAGKEKAKHSYRTQVFTAIVNL